MLAFGHEESPALNETRSEKEWDKVERFTETAASHALIPEDALHEMMATKTMTPVKWDTHHVRQAARKFRITPLAMATRLRESGFMNWADYKSWRAGWDKYVATLPPRKGGFANPAEKAVNKSGRPFVQLVLEALSANRLTPVDAARYLDLKFDHFDHLRVVLSQKFGASLPQ
jgi:Zn-dependent peptidase ImmA (M78 family)